MNSHHFNMLREGFYGSFQLVGSLFLAVAATISAFVGLVDTQESEAVKKTDAN